MQISPINNNQTNFKGQIIFKDAKQCVKIGKKAQPLSLLSIKSENISAVDGINDFGKRARLKMRKCFESIAPNMRKKYSAGFDEYKTVIKTESGDTFMVKNSPESISKAKQKLDGSSKFMEI